MLRTLRHPVTLRQYRWRYALASATMWFLVLGGSSRVVHRWLADDGLVSHGATLLLTAWTGFFVGFVVTCSAALQSRRKLLIGRLEPSPEEWSWLERCPARTLAGGFWRLALVTGLALGACLAIVKVVLGWIGELPGYPVHNFQFYTALLPACGGGLLASAMVRASVARFVSAAERREPLVLSRVRYTLWHSALPYALFSTAAGVAAALVRFVPWAEAGGEVAVGVLARHYAVTSFVLAVLVAGAAGIKTRLDVISPLDLRLSGDSGIRPRWRMWFGLVLPALVYAGTRLVAVSAGTTQVSAWTAVWVKAPLCLLIALGTTAWAVTSELDRWRESGLGGHSQVETHRFLREAGFLKPRDGKLP
jgi:hypothetical protein